tara:strand:+ start:283 stop:417 length:135 start_codon:yes stop_codon:yes gene_type:complete
MLSENEVYFSILKTAILSVIPKNIALAQFIYLFFKTLTIIALKQ